jgi:hypothetical protein
MTNLDCILLLLCLTDLKPFADRIAEERKDMYARVEAVFPPLSEAWRQHFQAAAQVSSSGLLRWSLLWGPATRFRGASDSISLFPREPLTRKADMYPDRSRHSGPSLAVSSDL